jgi:ADP-ribose pyrophosphatase YjhB (NUDIX family)
MSGDPTDQREGPQQKVDGWADIGYTPFEVATKEAYEETGLIVKPTRLLALFDKRKHPHPPQRWYVYKAFIECEIQGGFLVQDTPETIGALGFSMRNCRILSCRPIARRHLSWRPFSDSLPILARQRFATDHPQNAGGI